MAKIIKIFAYILLILGICTVYYNLTYISHKPIPITIQDYYDYSHYLSHADPHVLWSTIGVGFSLLGIILRFEVRTNK